MIHIRSYTPEDRDFVLKLAPRLTIGMSSWRDPQGQLSAVHKWIEGSIEQHAQQTMVIIAEDESGTRLGFASLSHKTHFSGGKEAYIGELATSEAGEGQGVGKALLQACEQWTRQQGYSVISLATGAANTRALDFYHRHGYRDEDITLSKLL